MLSDYINSCESIRKAVDNTGTTGGQGGGSGNSVGTSAGSLSQPNQTQQTNNCSTQSTGGKTSSATTGNSQTNICTPQTPVQQQQTQTTPPNNIECILKEFCEKVTKNKTSTCKVLEEIKNECNECDELEKIKEKCKECKEREKSKKNEEECKKCKELKEIEERCKRYKDCKCTTSENNKEKIKKFVEKSMENCKKEAKELIKEVNVQVIDTKSYQEMEPYIKEFGLKILCLLLYKRMVEEFILLYKFLESVIKNLTTCYDTIKSCACEGTEKDTSCKDIKKYCTVKGKCLCSIFYKLFKAIKLLHDRYCRIIKYMNGECDEDLYKIIPSLSITRSIIIISEYFKEYIESDCMVEEDKCGCRKNETKDKRDCKTKEVAVAATAAAVTEIGTQAQQAAGVKDGECTCHKYSSKLDDVVTLLLGGIEDVDDCDGLLSDVISMMSPLVEVGDCRFGEIKTETSENIAKTYESLIKEKLQEVNDKKKSQLNTAIPGINGDSNCGGTAAGSSNACEICSPQTSQTVSQPYTPCDGTGIDDGSIKTACNSYINSNGGSSTCTGSTICTFNCAACTTNQPGQCCCFCKDAHNSTHDTNIKSCLKNSIKKLNAEGINCNGNDCRMDTLEEHKFHHATLTLLKI